MDHHYFINSNNINENIKNIRLDNYNDSDKLPSDDLLSTHPLILSEDYGQNEVNKVTTQIEKNIILITSEERDFAHESLFDFRISFNKSSSKFVTTPVYFNNQTVPQNIYEREELEVT